MMENSNSLLENGLCTISMVLNIYIFRLLSGYGGYTPSRVRISLSPPHTTLLGILSSRFKFPFLFGWGQKWCQNFFDWSETPLFLAISDLILPPSPVFILPPPSQFSNHQKPIDKKDKKSYAFFCSFFQYPQTYYHKEHY